MDKTYGCSITITSLVYRCKKGKTGQEGDRLDVLTTLVEAYEEKHYKIPKPDPIDAILYYINYTDLLVSPQTF